MNAPFTIEADASALLIIDFQARLMPAISDGESVVANAGRLISAARLLDLPMLVTEQNPKGLGATVPELNTGDAPVVAKMTFDATRAPEFPAFPPAGRLAVVIGCEAHVCVLQTVAGLRAAGRRVCVVADAIGSRSPANKAVAIERMRAAGAEIVTTEMVVFEWAASAEHPRFKELIALIK
jgi:nicotinamidase-related amidase